MNKILLNLRDKIFQLPLMRNLYLIKLNWDIRRKYKKSPMNLIYKIEDLNINYYNKIKNNKNTLLEHNVGRFTNFRRIIKSCSHLEGDFVEFGTWQGFSLLWIAYLMEREAVFDRQLFGIDGFIGLPYNDGCFKEGSFRDTSLRLCINNIINNNLLYEETRKNIHIGKFLFKEASKIFNFFKKYSSVKFCFIHIDCDVSGSFKEIMDLLIKYDLVADRAFILFDDYGCRSELSKNIDKAFSSMRRNWKITVHSGTKETKNFILERV